MGSTRIVEGIYGCVGSNDVVISGMLVTPASGGSLVVSDVFEGGGAVVVGGSDVSVGIVLLPVGTELLPGKEVGPLLSGGGRVKLVVALVPVPGMLIEVLPGGAGVVVLSVAEMVEFVTGGRPGSLMVVDSDTGGSVTVAGALVVIPVPGPVIPSVGPRTEVEVAVAFGDGSKTLEMTESMSLRRELSGFPGSELLELGVTMPVGAIRIPDVLIVGTGSSSDVVVSSGPGVLVDVGSSSTMLLVLLPRTGGRTVEEGRSGSLVEVSLDELSSGELVLPGAVSVEEGVSDELSVEENVSDELSVEEGVSDELSLVELLRAELLVDEETLDEPSVAELLSDGSLVLLSDELSLEETLLDALLVVEVESEVGVGKGGETITVTGTTMVVTLESLDESDSELDCLLVVSSEVDGLKLSCDVVVALVSCRLTWRGK